MFEPNAPTFAAEVRLRGEVDEDAMRLLLAYWNRRLYERRPKDWT